MVARKYVIWLRGSMCPRNHVILCLFYKRNMKIYMESMYLCIIIRGF